MKKYFTLFAGLLLMITSVSFTQTWDYTYRITYNSGHSHDIKAAVDSSHVLHTVWCDNTPGNYEIFYKNAEGGGSGDWSATVRLTWTSGSSYNPFIAISPSDAIHVAWEDDSTGNYELYHKFSNDGGATWSSPQRITWTSGDSKDVHIFFNPTYTILPVVCYSDDTSGDYEIYYKEYAITYWDTPQRLTWSSGSALNPWGEIDAHKHIHIVWQDNSVGNNELYHKKSIDGGYTWSTLTRITYTSEQSLSPHFIFSAPEGTDSSFLRLAWVEDKGFTWESSIYYKDRSDKADVWSSPQRLTWSQNLSCMPSIIADNNGHIHIVYSDDKTGQFDLYHIKTTDEGASWSTITRLTWTTGPTYGPYLFMSPVNNWIRLVYFNFISGSSECFFKRGTQ